MKLTTHIIGTSPSERYATVRVACDQTARISLQISVNVKERGNKINQLRTISLRR